MAGDSAHADAASAPRTHEVNREGASLILHLAECFALALVATLVACGGGDGDGTDSATGAFSGNSGGEAGAGVPPRDGL